MEEETAAAVMVEVETGGDAKGAAATAVVAMEAATKVAQKEVMAAEAHTAMSCQQRECHRQCRQHWWRT